MSEDKNFSFASLFLSGNPVGERAMYVSTPPPTWLDGENMRELRLTVAGIYCLYFLVFSKSGGNACITVNGREIRGSFREEERGEICGSAICSIRELALPCSLGLSVSAEVECGILLVIRYEV